MEMDSFEGVKQLQQEWLDQHWINNRYVNPHSNTASKK